MSARRATLIRLWFRSYLLSALAHLVLTAVSAGLLMWWLPVPADNLKSSIDTRVAESTVSSGWQLRRDISIAQLEAAAAEPDIAASPHVNAATPVLGAFVRDELQRRRDAAADDSPESLLSQLERLGGELESTSGSESVKAMSEFLQLTLGMPESNSAKQSAEAVLEFEHASAQLDDVQEFVAADGSTRYTAVLIDASGTRLQVEMDFEEGRELYETFQLIKKFPLLEQVYRNVVMGLLQQLSEPSEVE